MSLKLAELVIAFPGPGLFLAYFFVFRWKTAAIPGTYARYRLSTWVVILCITLLGWCVTEGAICFAAGDYFAGCFLGVTAAVAVLALIQEFNNDDNWFNKSWKRLRREVNKLRKRLTVRLPRPVSSLT